MKIAVLAAGAWGTALALAFAARHPVTLWAREAELVEDMRARRENLRFLPGFPFPDTLEITGDLRAAVQEAKLLLLATPIAGLRPTVKALAAQGVRVPLLWVCKGFEAGSGKLPHQVVQEEMPGVPCGVLSGPSFAQEVAGGQPTAITLAANDADFARAMAQELHGGHLRIYASDDLVGAEVGGAVKNILAIATGVCDGLQLGLNARAALVTRGLAEIARLGVALGARKETFMGLAGVGDLILTCTGDLSRNRRVGLGLAAGKSLEQVLADLGHVAEGVPTALEVDRLAARLGVDMPITAAVAAVLQGRVAVRDVVEQLLARDPRDESC
ncbi:NAD(P)H-dependent glycerol-3-phosphate dehydrogenase [Azovibrio restrictus]|uniref:NAD(P)H-dependent glycerol-3-phosphate dehydrogenase n=1 Tax=Azovibrio restrictus TaxID=146938 RepID=UPI0026EF856F|nr:NAD(P)H-dependent glycerol-3-phosphate dehydrogenase [Azovibrio restrictus]MDD3482250.1 NAD(P)-dependent glycerol-3-phosphate dehydrogenase [Azovibrio restrictus]